MKRRRPLKRRSDAPRAVSDREASMTFAAAVIARDGCCRRCRARDGLHAHHYRRRSKADPDRHDPKNGIALCTRCHSLVHDHAVVDWADWMEVGGSNLPPHLESL